MADIKQKNFLRPGFYRFGSKVVEFTADQLRKIRNATNNMLDKGIAVPMLDGHAPAGKVGPGDRKASDNCGWLKHVTQETDGSLSLVGNITDKGIAQKIVDGAIRFTSPEIGKYVDGTNRDHGTVIRHMALTPAPRNPDQEDIMCLQLSEGDYIDGDVEDEFITFSELEEKMTTATIEAPAVDISAEMIALAKEQGAELPEGVDLSTPEGQALYITAVRNVRKGREEGENEEGSDGLTKPEKKKLSHEQGSMMGAMQYSESDEGIERIKVLEAKLAAATDANIRSGIATRIASAKVAPFVKKALSARVENMQFSDKDDTVFSIPEVLDMIEGAYPEVAQMSETETATVDDHPDGGTAFHTSGPENAGTFPADRLAEVAKEFLKVPQA